MSFDLEPLPREHVKRMAPNQKKNPTKKTKKIAAIKAVKKGASKKTIEKQLEKMGKQHEKIEMQNEKLEEKMEEGQELVEELVELVEEGLEKMEEQVEELKEKVEKKHDELKDKMEEGEESSSSSPEESEDEDDEGSTSSSSDEEEDGWLRGKMSGLFGSRTHFGSANPRQVQIQDLFADFFSPSPGAGRQWEWECRLQQKDGSKAKEEPNEENQEDCEERGSKEDD